MKFMEDLTVCLDEITYGPTLTRNLYTLFPKEKRGYKTDTYLCLSNFRPGNFPCPGCGLGTKLR